MILKFTPYIAAGLAQLSVVHTYIIYALKNTNNPKEYTSLATQDWNLLLCLNTDCL